MKVKILLYLFLISLVSLKAKGEDEYTCKRGVIDLSPYNYYSNRSVKLNGEWSFTWNEFNVNPDSWKHPQFVHVPGRWNSGKDFLSYNDQLGYGTYSLKVILPDTGKLWSLHLPPIHSSYKLFIDNKLVAQTGVPAENEKMSPAVASRVINFINHNKEIVLTLEVSNYYFVLGGIVNPIDLGNPDTIKAEREKQLFISAFLMGSLLIMGLYHMALFILWRKDKSFLYFAIICFFIALRESFGGDAFFYNFFSSINYEYSLKLLYLIFPVCLTAFILFFSTIYPSFSPRLKLSGIVISTLYCFLVLVTSNIIYGKYLPVISVLFLIESMYLLMLVIKETRLRPRENVLVLAGILVLVCCFLNDVFYEAGRINTYYLLPFGFFVFTLFQSVMLSIRFTNAFRKSETLSIELLKSKIAYNEMQSNFQQEIFKTKLEIQEQTFKYISQEIHDNIGVILSLVKLNLHNIKSDVDEKITEKIQDARNLIGKAIQDLRSLSRSLNTDKIQETGIVEAISAELQQLKKISELNISFDITGEQKKLDGKVELILFRIVQEALNNIIKHAEASDICISIVYTDSTFELTVKDNGKGFDINNKSTAGIGLTNMEARCKAINAAITINSANGEGTIIAILLPLTSN